MRFSQNCAVLNAKLDAIALYYQGGQEINIRL